MAGDRMAHLLLAAAEALEDAVSGEMARLGLTEARMAAESARLRREGGAR